MDDPMGRSHLRHMPVIVSLLAALLVSVAPAGASDPASAACDSLPGAPPDRAAALRDRVGLNFTTDELAHDSARVELCVLVDRLGVARELRVARGGTPF